MLDDLGPSAPDVIAWYKARQRESASRAVARQRLVGAIAALREEGHSIRQIAAILDVPQTRVVRLAGAWTPNDVYFPVEGKVSGEALEADSGVHAYWRAHREAWEGFPLAQYAPIDWVDSAEPYAALDSYYQDKADFIGRTILEGRYGITSPTPEQCAFAASRVREDFEGALCVAGVAPLESLSPDQQRIVRDRGHDFYLAQ